MNYKSVADLNKDILAWLDRLPRDIDVVVGIPRSGMLVANLVSLYLNKPLADIDGFCEGRLLSAGARRIFVERSAHGTALVLDDSVNTGSTLREAREKLAAAHAGSGMKYVFAAPYVAQDSTAMVDCYYQVLPIPRVFEWNLYHHVILTKSCMDIDGILCRDPSEAENDDGPRYRAFLSDVPVRVKPTVRVKYLVTCRLEKYRPLTEAWLQRSGIAYDQLIMLDLPDKESRLRAGTHAAFKAQAYRRTGAELFIESSASQAAEIARLSGKPVICAATGTLMYPDELARLHNRWANTYQILKGRLKRMLK